VIQRGPWLTVHVFATRRFDGLVFQGGGTSGGGGPLDRPRETREGAAALRDALAELALAPAAPALRRAHGMDLAARAHADDLGAPPAPGRTGHTGRDGSKPNERMLRHGLWYGLAAELCA